MISSIARGIELRGQVRAFIKETLANLPADGAQSIDSRLYRELGKAGWLGVGLPREAGGQGGTGIDWAYVLAGITTSAPEHTWAWALLQSIVRGPVLRLGSPELKRALLPALAAGEATACVGFTEPDAGADFESIRTVALSADGGYRITGSKLYTDAGMCSHMLITARTRPRGRLRSGMSLFIVPLASSGIAVNPIKMSFDSDRYEIVFEDVLLESHCLLGEENRGWEYFTTTVRDYEWTEARPTGRAANFLRLLVAFAAERPDDSQARLAVADLTARLFAARVAQFRAIQARDSAGDQEPLIEPAMAKLVTAETTKAILEEAVRSAGIDGLYERGSGAIEDDPMRGRVPLFARFLPSLIVAGWPSEVQRDVIADRRWPRDEARSAEVTAPE